MKSVAYANVFQVSSSYDVTVFLQAINLKLRRGQDMYITSTSYILAESCFPACVRNIPVDIIIKLYLSICLSIMRTDSDVAISKQARAVKPKRFIRCETDQSIKLYYTQPYLVL